MDPNTELASSFRIKRYTEIRELLDQNHAAAWREVIDAVRRRIDERFLRPIQSLARFDKKTLWPHRPGFAIVALDCLLIDTIQSFREGRSTTADSSPAKSFKDFLSSPAFSAFTKKLREEFFHYVRNAILHNGETRKDWKIRISIPRMVEIDSTTKVRTLNRRLFHAAVVREFRQLIAILRSGDAPARKNFLRRMDSLAGVDTSPLKHLYFAYGSNLVEAECLRSAPQAVGYSRAFLPRFRLEYSKHSSTRGADAATIAADDTSVVWGYVYRVSDEDRKKLMQREAGYAIEDVVVFVDGSGNDEPSAVRAFTFRATAVCKDKCGPTADYLDLVVTGAASRNLPENYVRSLRPPAST